jgi:S-adenosyl-L-methionine hydrolase (adenosine-forming)
LIFCPVNLPPKIRKTKLAVITIISDLGNFSLEAAKVNGVLLSLIPDASIVNINNGLPPWQIMDGIYLLKQSFETFPENTVHLFGVNNKVKKHIMAKSNNHWFLAPDNGALPEILKESNAEYFDLGTCEDPYFMYSFYPEIVKSLIASDFK